MAMYEKMRLKIMGTGKSPKYLLSGKYKGCKLKINGRKL